PRRGGQERGETSMERFPGFPEELKGLKVIDADTHYSEPHDLWTSRVPAKYREKVPHIADDGKGGKCWRFNGGDLLFSSAGSASVIRKDGTKSALLDWDIQNGTMPIHEIHPASYDPVARMEGDGPPRRVGSCHLSERGRLRRSPLD